MTGEIEMKLYVWKGFAPDYTYGLAFAIAPDEKKARESIEITLGYSPSDWGSLHVHTLNRRIAYAVAGGG